jgi:hypothetical protein
MATSGIVVAAVLLFVIGIIILVVVLATSAGSGSTSGSTSGSGSGVSPTGALAPPGSAGNWTPAQVATQAALLSSNHAGMFTNLGLPKTFIDHVFTCVTNDFSTRYGYDRVNSCSSNSGTAGCQLTPEDKLVYMRCMGGGEKGNWTAEMKQWISAAAMTAPYIPGLTNEQVVAEKAALEAAWPCIYKYLSDNYSFFDAIDELKRNANLDDAVASITPLGKEEASCRARGIPGSVGNWTEAQLVEQVRLFGALEAMSQLKDAAIIAEVSKCAMRAASQVYPYEYMNKCNTGTECVLNDQDISILSTCIGGVKGKWTN